MGSDDNTIYCLKASALATTTTTPVACSASQYDRPFSFQMAFKLVFCISAPLGAGYKRRPETRINRIKSRVIYDWDFAGT